MHITAAVAAALVTLSSLVLGEVASVSGVQVRRSSLLGFDVAGRVLDREEAAEAIAASVPAPAPEPRPGLVRVAASKPSLARAIHEALLAAREPDDGKPGYTDTSLGGIERVDVRYRPPVGSSRSHTLAWLERAQRTLSEAGMLPVVEGGKLVVMWAQSRAA